MQENFNQITASGVVYNLHEGQTPPCNLHWKDPNGHWNFWCPVTGGLSGSSEYPRTEYRETEELTSNTRNWKVSDFDNTHMNGILRIVKVPSSGKVIFAQVHAVDAPGPFVKLFRLGDELRAEVRFRPGHTESPTVIRTFITGSTVTYGISVSRTGALTIVLNGNRFECPIDIEWHPFEFYFKAGAYVIDNEGDDTEGGWVVYESLNVFHG